MQSVSRNMYRLFVCRSLINTSFALPRKIFHDVAAFTTSNSNKSPDHSQPVKTVYKKPRSQNTAASPFAEAAKFAAELGDLTVE